MNGVVGGGVAGKHFTVCFIPFVGESTEQSFNRNPGGLLRPLPGTELQTP